MYSEQPVAGLLGRSVECCWQVSGGSGKYAVAPDGCIDIIYSSVAGLFVVGAMTLERVFSMPIEARLSGVRIRPGMARAFLGLSVAELTDRTLPLEHFWGRAAREAIRRLQDEPCAAHLQTLLRPVETKTPVQGAIGYAANHHGVVNLDWIARQANLSPRQFRRRCLEETGLTPKRLCRILRFRQARRLALAAHSPDWADIAVQTGYCDQAHLIRDFREFTGRAPMTVLSNR